MTQTPSENPERLYARKVRSVSGSGGGYATRVLSGTADYAVPQNMHLSGFFDTTEVLPGDGTEWPSQTGRGLSGFTRTAFADLRYRQNDIRLGWTKGGPLPVDMFHFRDDDRNGPSGWQWGPGAWSGEGAMYIPDGSRDNILLQGAWGFTPALGSYEYIPRLGTTFNGGTIETEVRQTGGVYYLFMNLALFWRNPSDGFLDFRSGYVFLEYTPDYFIVDINGEAFEDFDDYYEFFEKEATYDPNTGEIDEPAVPEGSENDWIQVAITINPADDALLCHVNGKMIVKAVGGSNGNTSLRADYSEDINIFTTGEVWLDADEDDCQQGFMRVTQDALYDSGDYVPRSLLHMPPLTDTQQAAI